MKQIITTITMTLLLFISYGEWCKYYGQQSVVIPSIQCEATEIKLYDKHYTKASIELTCNGEAVRLDELRVVHIIEESNRRRLGLDL
jgi:hypothetical protein